MYHCFYFSAALGAGVAGAAGVLWLSITSWYSGKWVKMYSIHGVCSETISVAVLASFTYHSLINWPTYPISEVTDGIPRASSVQSSWSPPIVIPISSLDVPFSSPDGNGAF